MRILFLAPQPFYQERGTPIAVRLLLEELSKEGHVVDLLTYHEGEDVAYPGLTIHRIPRVPFAGNIRPGFSLKKLICDAVMFFRALRMVRRIRYDVVHAVEESAFIAVVIRRRYGLPFLYDMDSSLARQMAEKFRFLFFVRPLMVLLERIPIASAMAVVPMCEALEDVARQEGARKTFVLKDVSLLGLSGDHSRWMRMWHLPPGPRFMYVGNLESYQGVDLLLEAFGVFVRAGAKGALIIVGGKEEDILRYQDKARTLGIEERIVFLGPQPVSSLAELFHEADVLVSPRIKGDNTPMKIYSYLASGKAVLATDLPTHTQVLTPEVALLAPPTPAAFGEAMKRLAGDAAMRLRLGESGHALAARHYSPEAFCGRVDEIYSWVEENLRT